MRAYPVFPCDLEDSWDRLSRCHTIVVDEATQPLANPDDLLHHLASSILAMTATLSCAPTTVQTKISRQLPYLSKTTKRQEIGSSVIPEGVLGGLLLSMLFEEQRAVLAEAGDCIQDAAEETFMLFSQDVPHNDLGMVDNKAGEIDIDINGHDYSISQSLGLLTSNRTAGTTGAMVWKVTPRIAQWLSSKDSLMWTSGLLGTSDTVLELGCGAAGIIGMALSPLVASYILTDQAYVLKLLKQNINTNQKHFASGNSRPTKAKPLAPNKRFENVHILALDWEHDSVQNFSDLSLSGAETGVDVVVICDCVFNDFLIEPLTQTCIDICKMSSPKSTLVIVAQQLRAHDIFEAWLRRFLQDFDVWRLKDTILPSNLQSSSGYAIHMALFRGNEHS